VTAALYITRDRSFSRKRFDLTAEIRTQELNVCWLKFSEEVHMTSRKGIILAGGSGTGLHPRPWRSTQLLRVALTNPMIYYPLSTLMLAEFVLIHQHPQDTALCTAGRRRGGVWSCNTPCSRVLRVLRAFIIGEHFYWQRSALVLN
jgi:glucose-1-phosphate thymidylyltransferase